MDLASDQSLTSLTRGARPRSRAPHCCGATLLLPRYFVAHLLPQRGFGHLLQVRQYFGIDRPQPVLGGAHPAEDLEMRPLPPVAVGELAARQLDHRVDALP